MKVDERQIAPQLVAVVAGQLFQAVEGEVVGLVGRGEYRVGKDAKGLAGRALLQQKLRGVVAGIDDRRVDHLDELRVDAEQIEGAEGDQYRDPAGLGQGATSAKLPASGQAAAQQDREPKASLDVGQVRLEGRRLAGVDPAVKYRDPDIGECTRRRQ